MTSLRIHLISLVMAWGVSASGCWLPPGLPYFYYNRTSPSGSELVQPPLPQSLRHFALSANRRQVAYTAEVAQQPYELVLATLGGPVLKRVAINPNIEQLQWGADNRWLYYLDRDERVIPGEWSDWDLPRTEVTAYRLMALPVDDGEPRELFRSKEWISFQYMAKRQALMLVISQAEITTVKRLDVASGKLDDLDLPRQLLRIDVSPDGESVAFLDGTADGALTVQSLTDGKRVTLAAGGTGPLMWLPSGKGLVQVEADGSRPRLRTINLAGGTPTVTTASVAAERAQIDGARCLSPDGKRLWAFGTDDTNLVITLETGKVMRLESFGYLWDWLDNDSVMGAYRGGQYRVRVPAE